MAVVWEEVRLCEEKAVSYPHHSFFLPLLFPPRKDFVSTYKSQFPLSYIFKRAISRVDKENLRGINNLHVLEHEIFRKLLSSTAF